MKPTNITRILDLAWNARKKGRNLNPLFTGEAGLGKSQIAQQWAENMKENHNPNFGFLDLRIAYMEGPDLIGYPKELEVNGKWRTVHCLPGFWPTEGEGLLLIEEPNRGTTGVMNCLMQLLTDRKVHDYTLPDGWIIAAAINPESAEYDVNRMDTALRDRFEEYKIDYDAVTFMNFIADKNWSSNIQYFISSGAWIYRKSGEVKEDGKYISPRTWSKVEAAEYGGASEDMELHRMVVTSILGRDIGNNYWQFCHKESPVTARDLRKNFADAMKRLVKQGSKDNYKGDMINITVESIAKHYVGNVELKGNTDDINEEIMVKVAKVIPSDQAVNLITDCGVKTHRGQITSFFKEFVKRHPELMEVIRSHIKLQSALKNRK